MTVTTLLVLICATLALGQRPSFAPKPVGYPVVTTTEGLEDRFGEDGTTQRLPIEAGGDRDLIDRLSKLPVDKQPFWFINWQALEANRQKPQTYPQKPNPFVDPILPNAGSNSDRANLNSDSGSSSPNSGNTSPNSNSGTGSGIVNSNRFGAEEHPTNQESLSKDKIENAPTNSNSGSGQSNSSGNSALKTSTRDHKVSKGY